MAIRPIEMQMMIQQSNGAGQVKHQENHKVGIQQQQTLVHMDKNIQRKSESVVKKEDPAYYQEHYDAKEKGNNEYAAYKNPQKKPRKKEEEAEKERETINIDIKI